MKKTSIIIMVVLSVVLLGLPLLLSGCTGQAGENYSEKSHNILIHPAGVNINPFHPADTWGPYVGGGRHETITAPGGNSFTDVIGYPATGTGDYGWDLPVDNSGAPYPVITLCPGYGASADDWSDAGMFFGSWGFVCIVIDIGTHYGSSPPVPPGIDPIVAVGANTYALNYIVGLTSGHWLYGIGDANNAGAMGHSVGGRVCIGAVANDTRYKAVSPMCAAAWSATDPSKVHVPIQYQVGELDSQWTPETVNDLYPNSNPVKSMMTILGMGHTYGSGPAGPWVPLSYVETFFDYWLKHNSSCLPWVYGNEVKKDSLIKFECDTGGLVYEFSTLLVALPTSVFLNLLILIHRRKKKI